MLSRLVSSTAPGFGDESDPGQLDPWHTCRTGTHWHKADPLSRKIAELRSTWVLRRGGLTLRRPRARPPPVCCRTLFAPRLSAWLLTKIVAQGGGTVVQGVVCAVEQRHGSALCRIEDGLPGGWIRVQLLPIAPAKLLPFF